MDSNVLMRISVPCRGHHSLMEVFFIFFGCHVRAILGPKEDQVPQRNPKAAKPKPPLSMTYRKDSFTVRCAARSPIEYVLGFFHLDLRICPKLLVEQSMH